MPRKFNDLEYFLEFDPHKGVRLVDLADNMMNYLYSNSDYIIYKATEFLRLRIFLGRGRHQGGPTFQPYGQDINFILFNYPSRYIICRGVIGGKHVAVRVS